MTRVVLASNNPGKLRELNAMLGGQSIEVVPLRRRATMQRR